MDISSSYNLFFFFLLLILAVVLNFILVFIFNNCTQNLDRFWGLHKSFNVSMLVFPQIVNQVNLILLCDSVTIFLFFVCLKNLSVKFLHWLLNEFFVWNCFKAQNEGIMAIKCYSNWINFRFSHSKRSNFQSV